MKAQTLIVLILAALFIAVVSAERNATAPAAPAAPAANGTARAAPKKRARKPATILPPPQVPKPVKQADGSLLYPAKVVDPNAPQALYLGDGDAFRTVPVQVVHSSDYGMPPAAVPVLPPIPTLEPVVNRRAIRRVTKSLELLDRAYDALSAHLKQLAAMRAKVQAKLEYLQSKHIDAGYVLFPHPENDNQPVVPDQVKGLLRSYLINSLSEKDAVAKKGEVTPEDVVALIEAEGEVEAEAEAEADVEAEADEEAEVEAEAEAEAEAETEEMDA